jgi:excisionase family DNA binding protein
MKQIYELNSKEELEAIVSKAIENALAKSNSKKIELKDELLTTEELGAYLKLSRVSIWALTKNGILPFMRVGNQKRYLKSAVLNKLSEINHPKSPSYEGL